MDNMIKKLILFILLINIIMVNDVNSQHKTYNPKTQMMESKLSQGRRKLVSSAVKIGEILVGIGLFIRLAYVIKKVQEGLSNTGEIVNWGIAILVYIVLFEVVIKGWVYNFIGM